MWNLNETITAYDLAEVLKEEFGKFEVTAPGGEHFIVTSKPGHSISNLRPVPHDGNPQAWRIRKVADLLGLQETPR